MMMSSWAVAMMLVMGGQSNELLSILPTQGYWQAKGLTVTVDSMLGELANPSSATGEGPKAAAVRKLMALRALGELKDAKALPAIKKCLTSKTPFEAQYAAQAVAAIEGKPFAPAVVSSKAMLQDLTLLPSNCGMVAQLRVIPSGKPSKPIGEIIKDMGLANMRGPNADPAAQKKMEDQMLKQAIAVVEKVGNMRLDGATLGLSAEISDKTGFVVVIVRGQYEAEAIRACFAEEKNISVQKIGSLDVIQIEREFSLLLAPDRVVLVGGPPQQPLPVEEVAAAVEKGRGKLLENAALSKLIESVDTSGPIWGAALIGESYKKGGYVIAPFETASLASSRKGGKLDVNLVAKGQDPVAVKDSADQINRGLAKAREEMAKMAAMMPVVKSISDTLAAIEAKADGATMTITGKFSDDLSPLMGLPMFMFVGRSSAAARPAPPPNVQNGPAPVPIAPQ